MTASFPSPSPNVPFECAMCFVKEKKYMAGADLTLRYWRGRFYEYVGSHWQERSEVTLRSEAYFLFQNAIYEKRHGGPQVSWAPSAPKINNVMDGLRALCLLDDEVEPGSFIDGRDADRMIPCANGLLNVKTRELMPGTPHYFNLNSVPTSYSSKTPKPKLWLKYLKELWPDDEESSRALAQMFGYVLSGETSRQKMFALIGPPRSGKGTAARILTKLVGKANTAGPTLAALSERFGLEPLVGKSLAIIADARIATKNAQQLIERLLSISGEDMLQIDRKNTLHWNGTLGARIVIVSNEVPALADASQAIVSRFIFLKFNQSFLGREDQALTSKLTAELPGILNWALDGLDDLGDGPLLQPLSAMEDIEAMEDLASPIGRFVRERCELGGKFSVDKDVLFDAFTNWSKRRNLASVSDAIFAKMLRAACPRVRAGRPRSGEARRHVFVGIKLCNREQGEPGFGQGKPGAVKGASALRGVAALKGAYSDD